MKRLTRIFSVLAAAATVLGVMGCKEDSLTYDEIQISRSTIGLPAQGGKITVTVNATAEWKFSDAPDWFTVTPSSGQAGKTEVAFEAKAATDSQEADIILSCSGREQTVKVMQVTEKQELPVSTCAQINAGTDGVTYRAKGTCTKIVNTTYGNWYLKDDTGEVYVYGTLDKSGAEKNFTSLGIEVGDIVTVEGPRTTYGGVIELVNVTVIDIEKSLIKVEEVNPESGTLEKEGGEFTVSLTNKGEGVSVDVPADAKSWVSVAGISTGTTTVVTFNVAENTGGDRETTLTFKTTSAGVDYTATTTLSQKGSILEVNLGEFVAASVGSTVYRITAAVSNVVNASKGNFNIVDGTGTTYVYGLKGDGVADLQVGDVITLTGLRAEYKGAHQVGSGTLEAVKISGVTSVTVEEFLAKATNASVYYLVSGTVRLPNDTEIAAGCKSDLKNYGNFMLEDETGSVYVYGVVATYGAKNGNGAFEKMNIKEGDSLTVLGVRAAYKELQQVGSGLFFAHTAK